MNALKSVHGTPALRHSENDGVVSYFVEFPYEVAVRFVKHFLTDFNDGDFSGAFENLAAWGLQVHYHWDRLEDFEKVICETHVSKKNILKTKISRLFHV